MPYNRLWILIEGNDDERFIGVIKPCFESNYDSVQTWKYSKKSDKKIKNFLKSITAMDASYLFLEDINRAQCIAEKKDTIKRKYGERVDTDKVIIVVKEIESWYLAGLDDQGCRDFAIQTFRNTDNITKELFDTLMPKKFDSRIDFMAEILKRFSLETARQMNKSFDYFMKKIQVA